MNKTQKIIVAVCGFVIISLLWVQMADKVWFVDKRVSESVDMVQKVYTRKDVTGVSFLEDRNATQIVCYNGAQPTSPTDIYVKYSDGKEVVVFDDQEFCWNQNIKPENIKIRPLQQIEYLSQISLATNETFGMMVSLVDGSRYNLGLSPNKDDRRYKQTLIIDYDHPEKSVKISRLNFDPKPFYSVYYDKKTYVFGIDSTPEINKWNLLINGKVVGKFSSSNLCSPPETAPRDITNCQEGFLKDFFSISKNTSSDNSSSYFMTIGAAATFEFDMNDPEGTIHLESVG